MPIMASRIRQVSTDCAHYVLDVDILEEFVDVVLRATRLTYNLVHLR